ncbi:MAG TPA: hypothetical protein VID47_08885 [Actinomycetota bacterium]|jgi:hypothetical protein
MRRLAALPWVVAVAAGLATADASPAAAALPEAVSAGTFPAARAAAAQVERQFQIPESACVTGGDSAPAIERFLTGVPNGSVVLFPQDARCEVSRTVDLGVPPTGQSSRLRTTLDLNGATIYRTTEPSCRKIDECNGPVVALNLVNMVTLEGGSVQGGQHVDGLPQFDATREHDHGIAVHGSLNVTLFGLHVSDVAGDCVDVDKQKKDDAGNVRLIGTPGRPFTCQDAGRQGVSANAVTGLRIQGLTFDRIASTAVDLEPRRHGFIDGAVVQDNRFGWVGSYAIAGIGGGDTWKNVRIEHNIQTDPDHPGDAFLRAGNSFDRGPLVIVRNRLRARIQLNHTSGRAASNVLETGSSVKCMFELFNDPPFEVDSSNRHPPSTQLTCALEGKIANGGIVGTAKKLRKHLAALIVAAVVLIGLIVLLVVVLVRRRGRRGASPGIGSRGGGSRGSGGDGS